MNKRIFTVYTIITLVFSITCTTWAEGFGNVINSEIPIYFYQVPEDIILYEPGNTSRNYKSGLILALNDKTGKFGYVNSYGKEKIPFIYDQAYDFYDGVACVFINNKSGFINTEGKTIVPIEFGTSMTRSDDNTIIVYKKGMRQLDPTEGLPIIENKAPAVYDTKGNVLIAEGKFDDIKGFRDGLAPAKKKGKWGYINKKGEIVIPFRFDDALPFHNGLAAVRNSDWEQGIIDKTGNFVVPCKYASFDTELNDYHGSIINYNGYVLAKVYKNEENYPLVIELSTGKAIIPPEKYTSISVVYYNNTEKPIFTVTKSTDKYVPVGNKIGLCDVNGNLLAPMVYDHIATRYSNKARNNETFLSFEKDGKWGYLDCRTGKEIIPAEYSYTDAASVGEGLFGVSKNGHSGYVNAKNEVVIPIEYALSTPFFVDNGDIPATLQGLQAFKDDRVCIRNANLRYGVIDKNNKTIIPFTRQGLIPRSEGNDGKTYFITTGNSDKQAILDKSGKPVTDSVISSSSGTTQKIGERWAYINGHPLAEFSRQKGYQLIYIGAAPDASVTMAQADTDTIQ